MSKRKIYIKQGKIGTQGKTILQIAKRYFDMKIVSDMPKKERDDAWEVMHETNKHSGDCVNECHSCLLCMYEECLKEAIKLKDEGIKGK